MKQQQIRRQPSKVQRERRRERPGEFTVTAPCTGPDVDAAGAVIAAIDAALGTAS